MRKQKGQGLKRITSAEKIEHILEKASNINIYYKIFIITALIVLLFFNNINEYINTVFNPYSYYYDETMFLPIFDKYRQDAIPSTYIKDFTFNVMMATGFKTMLAFIYSHSDPHLLLACVKIFNVLAFTLIIGLIAWEIGGAFICFATISMLLSTSQFFFYCMNGITPRTFAYTFLALSILLMIRKNICSMALLVVVAALLYPQSAFILGTLMAIWLLLVPNNNVIAVNNWNIYKKFVLLAIAGILTFAAALPQMIASSEYGRRLITADIPMYPEIGFEGLFASLDSLPYAFLWRDTGFLMGNILATKLQHPISFIAGYFFIFFVIGNSFKAVYKQNPKITAVIVLMVTGVLTHTIAYLFSPYFYIAARYLQFTFPLFIILITPIATEKLIGKYIKNRKYLCGIITAIIFAIYSIGGSNALTAQLQIEKESRFKIYNFLESTPKDSVIAGWPIGITNNIPLFAHRNVLLSGATHFVFNKDYVDEMRVRTYAIINAYFATSTEPLIHLRESLGVTYFIVERDYFTCGKKMEYAQPFNTEIEKKLETMKIQDSILLSNSLDNSVIYEDLYVRILDLSKI